MKTISTHLNTRKPLITTRKLYKHGDNYDQAAGDINRNTSASQAEYQRDACEQELYRLRYGIENLLANNEHGDFQEQQQRQRFEHTQNPLRKIQNRINDMNNWTNMSWIERCSPCCRRWRRNRYDDNINIPDEYNSHRVYNDRNNELPTRRTLTESSVSPQHYGNSFMSTPASTRYTDPKINYTENDLRQSIHDLINRDTPNNTNISNLLNSREINDPIYNSLIAKILEAKALDCLCAGYSKQNTEKQISKALAEINERNDKHQWDSPSVTSSSSSSSSRSMPPSDESSSDISSILDDDESLDSHSMTSQPYSPLLSIIGTPNRNRTASTIGSPGNKKEQLKLTEDMKIPEKQSKLTIPATKTSKTSKSRKQKKKSSSKHRKTSSSKHARKPSSKHLKTPSSSHRKKSSSKDLKTPSSSHRKKSSSKHLKTPSSRLRKKSSSKKKKISSSKHQRKPSSTHRKKSTTTSKRPSRSKKSSTKRSSSRKKASSKSPSRSKSSRKSSKKKRTKPKSNNQVNDLETVLSSTFIYPRSYQEIENNLSIMRLFSIVSLVVFCLCLIVAHGQENSVTYKPENVAPNALPKDCRNACNKLCPYHCPDPLTSCNGRAQFRGPIGSRCTECLCPIGTDM